MSIAAGGHQSIGRQRPAQAFARTSPDLGEVGFTAPCEYSFDSLPAPIGSATLTFRVHGDLDLDGVVGSADLAYLLSIWGVTNPPLGDLNNDGVVGASDLSIFLGNWGPY